MHRYASSLIFDYYLLPVKVVEEPYTMREARIHVRHVRDLLKSVEPVDAYNGVDCASLSFLNTVCAGDIMEKKRARPDPVDCTPPDYVLPAPQVNNQCSGSMTFWCGSGSGYADPCL
jgi:hypothetical protein